MTEAGDTSMPEALFTAIARGLRSVHTGMPATVVSYSDTTRTATVTLATQLETAPGKWEPVPPLADVPVLWPGGNAGIVHVSLLPGDDVWVLFSEQDFSGWFDAGVPGLKPPLTQRHGLYAAAIPGMFNVQTTPPVAGIFVGPTGVDLGAKVGATPVALATPLSAWISTLILWLTTHTHPAPGGATSAPTTPPGSAPTIAATKVRAV